MLSRRGLPRLDAWIGRRSSRRLGEASPGSGCPWFDHLFSLFPSYRAIIRDLMRRTPAVRSSNGLSFRSPGFLRSPQPISAPGVGSVYSQSVAGAAVYGYTFLLATPTGTARLMESPVQARCLWLVSELSRVGRSLEQVIQIMGTLSHRKEPLHLPILRHVPEPVDTARLVL